MRKLLCVVLLACGALACGHDHPTDEGGVTCHWTNNQFECD